MPEHHLSGRRAVSRQSLRDIYDLKEIVEYNLLKALICRFPRSNKITMIVNLQSATFIPHGYCLSWQPSLLASFVLGNGLIALAYFSIPLAIFKFVRSRSDIEFRYVHWLFAAFITSCGVTHLLHIIELWWPIYYLEGLIDLMTAAISVFAAVVVWKLLPTLMVMPSARQLEAINHTLVESEARLLESETRLRSLGDNLPDSYLYQYTRTPDGKPLFQYLSSGVHRVHGVRAEDALSNAELLLKQMDPAQLPEYQEAETASRQNQSNFSLEIRVQRSDGVWRWVQLRSHPHLIKADQIVWYGIATDVTDRQLLESEVGRLAQAIEQNPTAMFITDIHGALEYINPAYTRVTGYQFQELYERPPHELLSTELNKEEFLQIQSKLALGKMWNGLLRNRHKNQEIYWEESSASPIYDHAGRISSYLFLSQDVTERENMLHRLELAAKVFAASNEALVITDHDNCIISVNPAFTRITGYPEQEVIGKNPKVLSSGRHDKNFYTEMWKELVNKGEWSGEIWNRRKDGICYPEWLSISTIKNHLGEVQNYVSMFSDITRRKDAEEKINYLAHYDSLTGLPNRTLLQDRVQVALVAAQRHKNNVAIIFLDLDRFKNVNDSLGHQVGDNLLIEVAKRLGNLLREEDTISRIGGDEFIIVMPDSDAQGAAHVASKVLHSISQNFQVENNELNIGVSIGISIYPDNGEEFSVLTQAADAALYRAKQLGRNNYQFFTDEMHEKARKTLRIENALRRAVGRNELLLHFQPQFDITGKPIVGAEALVRWHHPEFGLVPPSEFIPVAEESGLILEVGNFVLRCAVRQQAEWLRAGLPVVPVAVNLSLAQFMQPTLCKTVAGILEEYGLPAHLLELELTESMAMEDATYVIRTVDQLNALGIALSIDDFGTGYSSLSYLKRFRVHKIKIDQSFIRDLTHDPEDEAIVNAIISMARSLKFKVIAEGVETAEQLAKLLEQGCDEVQGYYFSKPLPAEQFVEMLSAQD
jgi:diguanylate cyclase (GGDEF)-like protein/PAS domain S-box-containing protein